MSRSVNWFRELHVCGLVGLPRCEGPKRGLEAATMVGGVPVSA